MAIVELVETGVYYVWAIATIIIGWGVWGLATAFVVRALVGTVLLLTLLPEGRVAPMPSWTKVRTLLGFGFRYQAVGLLHMLRDQGVNIAVATLRRGRDARALERRLADPSAPNLALRGALARLVSRDVATRRRQGRRRKHNRARDRARGHRHRRARRAARSLRVPVDPRAHRRSMGRRRLGNPTGMLRHDVRRTVSVALSGYLWAIGSASVPLRATVIGIPATLLVLVPLLPVIGVAAAGVAYIMSSLVESVIFVYAARRTTTFKIGSSPSHPRGRSRSFRHHAGGLRRAGSDRIWQEH